jgi:hypothetical protein
MTLICHYEELTQPCIWKGFYIIDAYPLKETFATVGIQNVLITTKRYTLSKNKLRTQLQLPLSIKLKCYTFYYFR